MKVAILTSYFYHQTKEFDGEDRIIFGGAERLLFELCKFLQSEGHEATVFQPLPMNDLKKQYTTIEKDYRGMKIVCLPTSDKWEYSTSPGLNYTFNEMAIWHDLRIYFASFMCFPEVRHPAISISHGIFWDFPNHLVRQGTPEQRAEFFRRQMYGFTAPDACVAVDTNVRGVIAAMEPGSEANVHVIPNFVNTKVFKPLEPGKKDWTRPRILYPRRLSTVRGINHFIKLTSQFPDCDFLVCGNGTDASMEAQLRQWSQGHNNIQAVWRPMEGMEEIYQMADIAVVPTVSAEGTSLSLLEAMSTGLPIITTPAGGLPNLVIPEYNGIVVDLNHGELAPALARLLKHPKLAAKMGRRSRQMAVDSFDISIWYKRWREVINKVVK